MSNLLHETLGSGDIDLQAENDRLREIIQDQKKQLEELRSMPLEYIVNDTEGDAA